jgi:hypothetical protein
MAKNLPHCETGFAVYRSAQLTPHPFILLLHLFSDHTLSKYVRLVGKKTGTFKISYICIKVLIVKIKSK